MKIFIPAHIIYAYGTNRIPTSDEDLRRKWPLPMARNQGMQLVSNGQLIVKQMWQQLIVKQVWRQLSVSSILADHVPKKVRTDNRVNGVLTRGL